MKKYICIPPVFSSYIYHYSSVTIFLKATRLRFPLQRNQKAGVSSKVVARLEGEGEEAREEGTHGRESTSAGLDRGLGAVATLATVGGLGLLLAAGGSGLLLTAGGLGVVAAIGRLLSAVGGLLTTIGGLLAAISWLLTAVVTTVIAAIAEAGAVGLDLLKDIDCRLVLVT